MVFADPAVRPCRLTTTALFPDKQGLATKSVVGGRLDELPLGELRRHGTQDARFGSNLVVLLPRENDMRPQYGLLLSSIALCNLGQAAPPGAPDTGATKPD